MVEELGCISYGLRDGFGIDAPVMSRTEALEIRSDLSITTSLCFSSRKQK